MSDAPERIWTCKHVGEYGLYFPEAVEAEGEYGGQAIQYIRADIHAAMQARVDALQAHVGALAGVLQSSGETKDEHINRRDANAAYEAFYKASLREGPYGYLWLNATAKSAFQAGWIAAIEAARGE